MALGLGVCRPLRSGSPNSSTARSVAWESAVATVCCAWVLSTVVSAITNGACSVAESVVAGADSSAAASASAVSFSVVSSPLLSSSASATDSSPPSSSALASASASASAVAPDPLEVAVSSAGGSTESGSGAVLVEAAVGRLHRQLFQGIGLRILHLEGVLQRQADFGSFRDKDCGMVAVTTGSPVASGSALGRRCCQGITVSLRVAPQRRPRPKAGTCGSGCSCWWGRCCLNVVGDFHQLNNVFHLVIDLLSTVEGSPASGVGVALVLEWVPIPAPVQEWARALVPARVPVLEWVPAPAPELALVPEWARAPAQELALVLPQQQALVWAARRCWNLRRWRRSLLLEQNR